MNDFIEQDAYTTLVEGHIMFKDMCVVPGPCGVDSVVGKLDPER